MIKNTLCILLITLGIFACKKSEDSTVSNEFDDSAFLSNAADNLIVPAYVNALESAKELQTASNNFTANSTDANLVILQTKWKEAFLSWQIASPYNFGPAEGTSKNIMEFIATFPIDITLTESIISAKDYSFNDFNVDTRGFATVGYLVNNGTNTELIASFDSYRKAYLSAVITDIVDRLSIVTSTWQSTYRDVFVANTGTATGGSISDYYNQFLISYEGNKNYKLAFPAGLGAGQSGVQPHLVEAYYGGFSLDLAETHLQAIENIWYGNSTDGTIGIGFDDFLETVEGGEELKTQTISSLENVWVKMNAIPKSSLVETLNSDPMTVISTVEEMQKHTRYFKSDLSTKIGVAVTYSDGDGD